MHVTRILIAACVLSISVMAHSQGQSGSCPSTKSLDQLINALDAAVSGPTDKDRACLRQILVPEARLIPVGKAKDGAITPRVLSVDDWITRVRASGHKEFYEVQTRYPADIYGNIAHLWSTYEVRPTPDGKPDVRGINSIQAIFNGSDWKVIEIVWQAETPDNPIPRKYLP